MVRGPQLIHIPFFELISSDAEWHVFLCKKTGKIVLRSWISKKLAKNRSKSEKMVKFRQKQSKFTCNSKWARWVFSSGHICDQHVIQAQQVKRTCPALSPLTHQSQPRTVTIYIFNVDHRSTVCDGKSGLLYAFFSSLAFPSALTLGTEGDLPGIVTWRAFTTPGTGAPITGPPQCPIPLSA